MKHTLLLLIITAIILCFPSVFSVLSSADTGSAGKETQKETVTVPSSTEISAAKLTSEMMISVYDPATEKTGDISFEKYIIGAVAAQMPAQFADEALKAQALAVASLAEYQIKNPTPEQDKARNKADISSDAALFQPYLPPDALKTLWGGKYDEYHDKILHAVKSVGGLQLTYDGEVIMARSHDISGGETANASEILGEDIKYLTSVNSSSDRLSPDYLQKLSFTEQELSDKLGISAEDMGSSPLSDVKNTDGGYLISAKIGNVSFSGTELVSLLSLGGLCCDVEHSDKSFILTVHGSGDGLGMSRYAADFMARQGSDFTEILLHYYPGAMITVRQPG